jgi:UPF0716 protein FxsA
MLGTWLVRNQGQLALHQLRSSFQQLNDPTEPLAHGAMILVAGALLLTPGFFTDAVGFALLMPPVRDAVYRYLRKRVSVMQFQMGPGAMHGRHYPGGNDPQGDIIDGDFEEVDPKPRRSGPSRWVDGPEGPDNR